MERKEQSAHSMNATAGGTTATGGCAGENLSDQLTILQEVNTLLLEYNFYWIFFLKFI